MIGTELIQHGRRPNVQLQVRGGSLFDRSRTLQVVAIKDLAAEEPLVLDYAPGKLENQVRSLAAKGLDQARKPGVVRVPQQVPCWLWLPGTWPRRSRGARLCPRKVETVVCL